jgi:MFS family permease
VIALLPRSQNLSGNRVLLSLLFAINLLNYIDRLTISGLLEPIGKDLHLSDAQLGQVALAFLIPYSVLPPIVGWIGDRAPRSRLIAFAVCIWSMATGVAGVVRSFAQLAATRAVVGVGEATYMSLSPSMIADAYPPGRRGSAMSLFYIASPVGAALGVFLGGVIGAAWGWRIACLVVGVPGVAMALAMWFFPEPKRGGLDPGEQADRPSIRAALAILAGNKPYLLLTLAYTVQLFAYNPIEFWLPTVLQRDKGMPLVQANSSYGAIVVIAGTLGPLLGGFLADRFAQRSSAMYYRICIVTALASVLPIVGVLLLPKGPALFTSIFAEVFLANMSTGVVFTILVTIVMPGLRATATAVLLTVIHLLGDAISEPLIGTISSRLATVDSGKLAQAVGLLPANLFSQHLTLALCSVAAPAMAVSGILYIAAIPSSRVQAAQGRGCMV